MPGIAPGDVGHVIIDLTEAPDADPEGSAALRAVARRAGARVQVRTLEATSPADAADESGDP